MSLEDGEWDCSTNHPKLTPEFRKMLDTAFGRLAALNVKGKLSAAEKIEQKYLAQLHQDFRFGLGFFQVFIGQKYFNRKYQPK